MESLALLVSVIFLLVIFLGPISLVLHKLGLRILASIVAVLAVLIGGYWACVAPFPICLVGGIGILFGMLTINRY